MDTAIASVQVDEGGQPTEKERSHREGKAPMTKEEERRPRGLASRGLPAPQGLPTGRARSPKPIQTRQEEGRNEGEDDNEEDDNSVDVTHLEAEEEERVQWEVFHRFEQVKTPSRGKHTDASLWQLQTFSIKCLRRCKMKAKMLNRNSTNLPTDKMPSGKPSQVCFN